MILSKQFLNEQVQKRNLQENFRYDRLFYEKRQELDQYDVFVSYSWNDRSYADKIVQLLEQCGYTVYIDYNDKRLDRNNVSEETAKRIINEMKKCKGLLYLYSPSSSVSKWCPWEVGVFSGMKSFRCANLPLTQNRGDDFKKQEYLEIYPYVDYEATQDHSRYDFWVCESDSKYTTLKSWLNGGSLKQH
jgi:hypothetical protein